MGLCFGISLMEMPLFIFVQKRVAMMTDLLPHGGTTVDGMFTFVSYSVYAYCFILASSLVVCLQIGVPMFIWYAPKVHTICSYWHQLS